MKPLALSLVISANLVAVFSFGQVTYSHYLDETSQWHLRIEGGFFDPDCGDWAFSYGDAIYYISGDTLLNGQWYYNLYSIRRDSIACENSYYFLNLSSYNAIREDSVKRIYRYSSSGDQLLWDFNISIGDWIGNNSCHVENIDTVWVGSTPHQRYICHCDINNILIEGIGASQGIFSSGFCSIGFESSSRLVCYSQQGHTLQVDSVLTCNLQPVTGLAPVEKNNPALIDIFPNPGRDEVFLRLHAPLLGDAPVRIRLINAMGQTVLSAQGAGAMHRLDISTVPKGLYVVEVVSSGANITKQVIKQ